MRFLPKMIQRWLPPSAHPSVPPLVLQSALRWVGQLVASVGSGIAVSVGGTGVAVGSGVFALQAANNRPRMTNAIVVFFI